MRQSWGRRNIVEESGKKKRSLAEEEGVAWNIQLNSGEAREGDNFAQIYLNTVLG